MLREVLIAVRRLRKRPGYSVSVVATLAFGIGGSTLMFSLLDAALLRPLPFVEPERLVSVLGVAGPERAVRGASFPELADWRAMNATLEHVTLYDETSLNLRLDSEAIRVETELVSASYFPLLGASAAIGRTFLPEEDAVPDRNAVAVVSHRLWRDRLGSDPLVLERIVHLNDRPMQIVGVMPEGFSGISFDTDLWVPSMMISLTSSPGVVEDRGTRWLLALARLEAGVSVSRAQEDLTRVAALLEQQYPDYHRARGAQVLPLRDAVLGDTAWLIAALFGAVILFLVVSCTNVAALLLVRATSRRRELAVILALGATRWHVLRQLLTEAVVLSLAAGTIGAIAAAWSAAAIVAVMPAGALPLFVQPAIDVRALAFALLASLVVGVLVSILPGVAALRSELAEVLRQGARSAGQGLGSIRRLSIQQTLVIAEIALAMTLLTAAALMVRSLERQMRVSIGFDPAGLTVGRLSLPGARYTSAARAVFVERLEERLSRVPGVRAVAIGSDVPFTEVSSASILVPGGAAPTVAGIRYYRHFITPGYFEAFGIPVTQGRAFTALDHEGAPLVAIINESAVQRITNAADAVGRRFRLGRSDGPVVEIVGVVRDARYRDLTTDPGGARTEPDVFFPFAQRTDRDLQIAVRTDGAVAALAALQQAVSEIDAGLPLYEVRPLEELVRQQTSTSRFASALLAFFSAGALLLAALGLYGLVAYVVSSSRQEIAIRLALGADGTTVTALIVRNGMILVLGGIVLGTLGAIGAARTLEQHLFQTSGLEPAAYASVAALLLAVTFIASFLPTWRAVSADPHAALRDA
ncbi:MAG TPA: ABC transporter permease [Vicinamibacterales bacterium]|nr:ABC transporter permease [Vicinamibacterales bacterium]